MVPKNYLIKGIVCHRGISLNSGHYVSYVKKSIKKLDIEEEVWLFCDDTKISEVTE